MKPVEMKGPLTQEWPLRALPCWNVLQDVLQIIPRTSPTDQFVSGAKHNFQRASVFLHETSSRLLSSNALRERDECPVYS